MNRDQEFFYFQRCMTENAEYRDTHCEYCGDALPCDCNNTSFSLFNDAPADSSMAGAPPKECNKIQEKINE